MSKPKKDDYDNDESVRFLQGTSTGVYSFMPWSSTDKKDKTIKKKARIGFVDTNKKKK